MTKNVFIIQYDSGNPGNGCDNYFENLFFFTEQEAIDFLVEHNFEQVDLSGYDRVNQPQCIPVRSLFMNITDKPVWRSDNLPHTIVSVFERPFEHNVLFGGTTTLFDQASIIKLNHHQIRNV